MYGSSLLIQKDSTMVGSLQDYPSDAHLLVYAPPLEYDRSGSYS